MVFRVYSVVFLIAAIMNSVSVYLLFMCHSFTVYLSLVGNSEKE